MGEAHLDKSDINQKNNLGIIMEERKQQKQSNIEMYHKVSEKYIGKWQS